MKRRLLYLLVVLVVALVAAEGSVWAHVEERIIYVLPGNALIAYGGDKTDTVLTPSGAFPRAGDSSAASRGTKYLSDSQTTDYGNSYVETWFSSTVRYDAWTLPYWAEVERESNTAWWGTEPQLYSDVIRLDEGWTFNGISVYVSYPPGFSSTGNTVAWSGEDDSGTAWKLRHIYSGIRGQSWIGLSSVRQSSNGSHYFSSDYTWVSANATDGVSVAF